MKIFQSVKNSPFRILVVVSGSGTDDVASPEAAAGVLNLISRLTEPSSSITVRVWTWTFPPDVVKVVKLVLENEQMVEPVVVLWQW